ncbi:hypothetical protein DNHGIG_25460 [Collibacillus ludicampi]|uniref:Uncharacterized protein n=1 Tax=Collibacillus ludicampi TaxID=2771369 RepID=A0AAV4LGP8_9BACL|nr:hypothetical protein [Collibacillus ludicampi]GIM46997.1 hypothetical protein DNHGIG_25460 [Collibacillus ludicampi]
MKYVNLKPEAHRLIAKICVQAILRAQRQGILKKSVVEEVAVSFQKDLDERRETHEPDLQV